MKLEGVVGEGSLEDGMNAKRGKLLQTDISLFKQISEEILHFPLCLPCTTSLSPAPRVKTVLNRLFVVWTLALLTL